MRYFDTHTHITLSPSLTPEHFLRQAREAGVEFFLDPGLFLNDFPERWEKLSQFENVFLGIAIAPHHHQIYCHNEDLLCQDLAKMEKWVTSKNEKSKKIVALSEIGYEFFHFADGYEWQDKLFEAQVDLAIQLDLPIFLHLRNNPTKAQGHDAYQRASAVLQKKNGKVRGAVHCFSGDKSQAKAFLDLDFYVSFSGIVTFKNAKNVQEAAKYVPANRMLSETDSPYLAPTPHRGKENHSAYLPLIHRCLADLKGKSVENLTEILTENAFNLLQISPKMSTEHAQ